MTVIELRNRTESLLQFKKSMDQHSKLVIPSLMDTSIDLTTRWEAYIALVKANVFAKNDTYSSGFTEELCPDEEISHYDEFNFSRSQTTSYPAFYKMIMESDSETIIAGRTNNIDAWKEAVLQSGYTSFTFDW